MDKSIKIIGCGDIHMSASTLSQIPEVEKADLLIVAGDLTNFGGAREAQQILDEMEAVNPNLLAQIGNLDKNEVNEHLEKRGINLHGHARMFGDTVCLVGIGGSNPTPFNTPSEFSEEELYTITSKAFKKAQLLISQVEKQHTTDIPTILVSHTPPCNSEVDTLSNGNHAGSISIRKIIEEYQPELCITGHIHEARGVDRIRNTPIINPGMLCNGGWINIIINDSHITATLETITS